MDEFCTWQDLLLEEEPSTNREATSASQKPEEEELSLKDLIQQKAIPQELAGLLKEREELEQQFKALTGKAEPKQDEERIAQMYPVFAHTKESRIQEKRLRARDERRAAAQKRRLEAKLIERKKAKKLTAENEAKGQAKRVRKTQLKQKQSQKEEVQKRQREKALIQVQREKHWKSAQEEALRNSQLKQKIILRWQETREASIRTRALERINQRRTENKNREAYMDRRREEASQRRMEELLLERKRAKAEEIKRFG